MKDEVKTTETTVVEVKPDNSAMIKNIKQIAIWSLVTLGALFVISKLTDKKVPVID